MTKPDQGWGLYVDGQLLAVLPTFERAHQYALDMKVTCEVAQVEQTAWQKVPSTSLPPPTPPHSYS